MKVVIGLSINTRLQIENFNVLVQWSMHCPIQRWDFFYECVTQKFYECNLDKNLFVEDDDVEEDETLKPFDNNDGIIQ